MRIIYLLSLSFFLLGYSTAFSQKTIYLGASINGEFLGDANPRLGGGLTFEKKFAEHHGFETGIFYRNLILPATVTITNSFGVVTDAYNSSCFESYISFPVQYKFYSNKVNFSLGFNFDYLAGYSFSASAPDYKSTFHPSTSAYWKNGISAKVSKSYALTSSFILEPEIRFNMIASTEPHVLYAGIGLTGKFDMTGLGKSKEIESK